MRNATNRPANKLSSNMILFRSAVGSLLLHRSPPAIAGLVPTVVVDTLNGQPRRAVPHIRVEVLERKPSVANSDATGKIILSLLVIGLAPHADSFPSAPLSRCRPPMSDGSRRGIRAKRRYSMAAAGYVLSRKEILPPHLGAVAAIALQNDMVDQCFPHRMLNRVGVTKKHQFVHSEPSRNGFDLSFAHSATYQETAAAERNL